MNRYLATNPGARAADADALFDALAGRGVARIARRDLELRRTMLAFHADRATDFVATEVAHHDRVHQLTAGLGRAERRHQRHR